MTSSSLDTRSISTSAHFERRADTQRTRKFTPLQILANAFWNSASTSNRVLAARSKMEIWIACLLLSSLISYTEYMDHLRLSLVLFYIVPISITAWFVGYRGAFTLVIAIMPIWLFSIVMKGDRDRAITIFSLNRFIFFAFFGFCVARLKDLQDNLETLAEKRSLALTGEAAERERLEREMLDISEREQRRIGQDLHDGLCQQLTGTAMLSHVHAKKLSGDQEAASAKKITDQIEQAITLARSVAKGLSPVETGSDGLMQAFEEFSLTTSELFEVSCRFECDLPVLIETPDRAGHLFRIAQEAVSNAIKHGKATEIRISLKHTETGLELSIADNGSGFAEGLRLRSEGMGLRTMSMRSRLIGGEFIINKSNLGGAEVSCFIPEAV
jgi:signal transduction histidine kinase